MKQRIWLWIMGIAVIWEISALYFLAVSNQSDESDAVLINELVNTIQERWDDLDAYHDHTGLDYVILDQEGAIRFETRHDLSTSINTAIRHRDTILDVETNGVTVGKIIIANDSEQVFIAWKQKILTITAVTFVIQCLIMGIYLAYMRYAIIVPFQKLKAFAQRVAAGNLDVPLKMDRQNVFGAFTESFDIMRSELQRSRQAEAQANASKKELVAKLSHDIKTPVASIKATAELGMALCEDDKQRQQFTQIMQKSDQINTLVSDLFTATLEELNQLTIHPIDIESDQLVTMLENADYLHRATLPMIPGVLLYADPLRLQQVLDNIFANSYKYANTAISVTLRQIKQHLVLEIEDEGGGVLSEELPRLKDKYFRGANREQIEGAGLGLYVSDTFMREMGGELLVENGEHGLKVSVMIAYSGAI